MPPTIIDGTLQSVKLLNDDKRIALFGMGFNLQIIDTEKGEVVHEVRHPPKMSIIFGDITKDGKTAYGGGATSDIGKYDVETGALLNRIYASPTGEDLYGYRPTIIRLSPDEKWLAVGTGPTGDTYLYQTSDMSLKKVLKHRTTVSTLSFSPDSSHLAVEAGGLVRIWKVD